VTWVLVLMDSLVTVISTPAVAPPDLSLMLPTTEARSVWLFGAGSNVSVRPNSTNHSVDFCMMASLFKANVGR
jgi:hypothetical protein